MLGFQAAPRLFSRQADKQFCLCISEYEMSTCVIYCTNSHLFGFVACFYNRRQEKNISIEFKRRI